MKKQTMIAFFALTSITTVQPLWSSDTVVEHTTDESNVNVDMAMVQSLLNDKDVKKTLTNLDISSSELMDIVPEEVSEKKEEILEMDDKTNMAEAETDVDSDSENDPEHSELLELKNESAAIVANEIADKIEEKVESNTITNKSTNTKMMTIVDFLRSNVKPSLKFAARILIDSGLGEKPWETVVQSALRSALNTVVDKY